MSSTDTGGSFRQGPDDRDEATKVHTEGFGDPRQDANARNRSDGPSADFREDARQARDRLNEGASSAARDMKARAASFADEQKGYGAQRLEGVASVVDRAADDLERELPEAADLVRGAARSLNDVSRNLRDRSTGDLLHSVNDFARREPAAFFGSAVLAGFALSRFLKSTSDRPVDAYASSHSSTSQGSHAHASDVRGTHAQHNVARPDERGSWPEMEEASVTPAPRTEATWDRPSDSPALADDPTRAATVGSGDVSPTEPGMGYSNPNANRN